MLIALQNEIAIKASRWSGIGVETIYFGGGTPSILAKDEIAELYQAIESAFDLSLCQEVTLEANPEDITAKSLAQWSTIGINRLSVGIQSFDDGLLANSNRIHTSRQSLQALEYIRESRFENFSIDLIFGLPGFTRQQWIKDLQMVTDFKVPHLAVYSMTIEPKTVFGNWHQKGKLNPIDEEEMTWAFKHAHHFLSDYGYEHYEVSNYALPGQYSRHNASYWQGKSYIGIGPGAHSFDQKTRSYNVNNNNRYIKSLQSKELAETSESLSNIDRVNEIIFTSLRTRNGLDARQLQNNFEIDLISDHFEKIRSWQKMKLVQVEDHVIRLTLEGLLIADEISLNLLYS